MKVKGIVVSILIVICIFLAMPFSVYAENTPVTITSSNIIGVFTNSASSNRTTSLGCYLDDEYVGTLTLKIAYTPISGSAGSQNVSFFFNGSVGYGDLSISGPVLSVNFTSIVSQNLKLIDDNILTYYDFPIESLSAVMSLGLGGHEVVDIDNVGAYVYPTFSVPGYSSSNPDNSQICKFTINPANPLADTYILIFGINKNVYNQTSLDNAIYWRRISGPSVSYEWVETLYRNNVAPYSVVKCKISFVDIQTASEATTISVHANNSCKLTPIYFNYEYPDNISLDFALQFNLDNELLKALQQIKGNDASDQAAADLNDDAEEMQDSFDDMFTIEDQYNQDLNDQIDNIDFTNPLQNNQSLLSSGNFVIQVFNGLIANNPISILIIIACILLVARRLFG